MFTLAPFRSDNGNAVTQQPNTLARKSIGNKSYNRGKLFNPENTPTFEEIGILKKEKTNLIQERCLLKAKVARLIDIGKHPNRHVSKNSDPNILEKEWKHVEQLSAARRAEITQLKSSDLASIVNELQQDCLMLHMELIRVSTEKNRLDAEIREVLKSLQEVKVMYAPDLEIKQARIIRDLEKDIAEQKIKNAKIKMKIEKREFDDHDDEQINNPKNIVKATFDQLEGKIQEENDEIAKLEMDIKRMEAEQQVELEELQKQII